MTWLFLTSKALYLMHETGCFLDKVDLGKPIAPDQYRVELPLTSWFGNQADQLRNHAPWTLVIAIHSNVDVKDPYPGINQRWLLLNKQGLYIREDGDSNRIKPTSILRDLTPKDYYLSELIQIRKEPYEKAKKKLHALEIPAEWFLEESQDATCTFILALQDNDAVQTAQTAFDQAQATYNKSGTNENKLAVDEARKYLHSTKEALKEPEPLVFYQLEQRLSKREYEEIQDKLSKQAWKDTIAQEYSQKFSTLLFMLPNNRLNEENTHPVPYQSKIEPTFGQLLLWTVWNAGLTPRAYRLTEPKSAAGIWSCSLQSMLIFKPFPKPDMATFPTSIATLERAVRLRTFRLERPRSLHEVLTNLADEKYYGIQVNADPSLLPLSVSVKFLQSVSFTEVMDAIALHLNAVWDWQGDSAVLCPLPVPVSHSTALEMLNTEYAGNCGGTVASVL
jgi:hypothetical protein